MISGAMFVVKSFAKAAAPSTLLEVAVDGLPYLREH
jgi:hypothetical protein